MEIREARVTDLDAISRLYMQVRSIHSKRRGDLFKDNQVAYDEVLFEDVYNDDDAEIIVVEDEGEICGYAFYYLIFTENDATQCDRVTLRVDEICVDESKRNKGIGKMLMDYMKTVAKQRGCYDMTLFVHECNPKAKAFYEKQGMQVRSSVMEMIILE